MKALVVRQFGTPLKVEEWIVAAPGAGEVLVDVHAAGINFPDLLVIDGKYQFLPPLPFVPGKLKNFNEFHQRFGKYIIAASGRS